MTGIVPARRRRHRIVVLSAAETGQPWASGPVLVATGYRQRLLGLRPWPTGFGLLLAGAAVHGHGMAETVRVIGIDATGTVLDRRAGAAFVVELPLHIAPPPSGAMLVIAPWRATGPPPRARSDLSFRTGR